MEPTTSNVSSSDIVEVIIYGDSIIIRTRIRIFIFDDDLNLKIMSSIEQYINSMTVLPNDQIAIINKQSLRIYK